MTAASTNGRGDAVDADVPLDLAPVSRREMITDPSRSLSMRVHRDAEAMRLTRPDPAPDDLGQLLVQWPAKALEELLLAPWTVARARYALTELPDKIDELTEALDRTTANLDVTVRDLAEELLNFKDSLDAMLPPLSDLVTGLDGRIERLEDTVRDLGDSVVGVLGIIPGMKRRLSGPRP